MRRKICVITGSRSEYGILYYLIKELSIDKHLDLQLVVTGMHLSPEFGLTYKEIEKDGFTINEKVDMLLSSDTTVGITKAIGRAVIEFADVFDRLRPDLIVINGDRYEVFAAAQAAMIQRIPIAHISGGEITEGSVDDAIRHSLTKMSHLHFANTKEYQKRIIQLGEDPSRVFSFGSLSLDNIKKLKLMDRNELEASLDFKFGEKNFLVTYHPVTLKTESQEKTVRELLEALDSYPEANIFFTKPNADADNRVIAKMIDSYAEQESKRVYAAASLGKVRYLSLIRHVDVVIGNSSSGLIEVPAFCKPTVNIGNRQHGRVRGRSVIDCDESTESIKTAIEQALSSEFRAQLKDVQSPYVYGNASVKIKDTLKNTPIEGLLRKKFYEVGSQKSI